MDIIFELDIEEKKWWKKKIKTLRDDIVLKPRDYVKFSLETNNINLNFLRDDINNSISVIRETAWNKYLVDESKFHTKVISELIEERKFPTEILNRLSEKYLDQYINLNKEDLKLRLKELIGEFSGNIMPYLYDLSLSTTNSRRSRAGTTFEALIETFLELYNYPFENQSSLGNTFYAKNNLGKMVDVIIPSKNSYEKNRGQCIIVTMKTTLRERWQEVVEEINRTNIPQIHLLTLDQSISKNLMEQLKSYNIVLVTYDSIKQKLTEFENIIGFSEFFDHEIPHQLDYWNKSLGV